MQQKESCSEKSREAKRVVQSKSREAKGVVKQQNVAGMQRHAVGRGTRAPYDSTESCRWKTMGHASRPREKKGLLVIQRALFFANRFAGHTGVICDAVPGVALKRDYGFSFHPTTTPSPNAQQAATSGLSLA